MTALELLSLIANGGVLLGAGAGGIVYGLRKQRERSTSSRPPAPALTDSQRMEIPFVAHELCDERHERIDARLGQIDTKLGTVAEGVAEIRGVLAAKGARR